MRTRPVQGRRGVWG
ncbi:hypothetical protein STRTUCAR8_05171, partial [Streptomyces turgidiscabies Car8]